MAKVLPIRPQTFTENERLVDEVREHIFRSQKSYKEIATACKVSAQTVGKLARGQTKWPRPTTLFPLIDHLGLRLLLVLK